ncbi:MAG: tRNA uracil 4-sulfurtransferase ThiI [Candidatus Hydrothermarchaeota archaeon]
MIIVRYGEIGTKSRRTRSWIEHRLVENIKEAIGGREVLREYGRIFVKSDSRADAERVAKVFGVVSTSLAEKTSSSLDALIPKGLEYARARVGPGESFAVRARRVGEQGYTSRDAAILLGEAIIKATGARVDLKAPDKPIYVEIRGEDAYLYDGVIEGVGGLPLGTQGKAVALVSGGIDSPVATWMMMKRGVEPICLFMDARPLVDNRTRDRALKALERLAGWRNGPLRTYIAPYGDVLLRLLKAEDPRLGCVLCKRMMYRVGEMVAEREGCKALITGESLGQVASQTMENLYVIDRVTQIPVFRPLLGMDKEEIVRMAKRIETYEISILPANCCLGPPLYPETMAREEKVLRAEAPLDVEAMAKEIFRKAEIIEVR